MAQGAAPRGKGISPQVATVAAVCAVLVIAVAVFAVPRIIEAVGGSSSETASRQLADQQAQQQSDGAQGSATENAVSQQVQVKSGISEYSWADLSNIAAEIERTAKNRDDAVRVAASYNLVKPDGSFTGETKTLQTSMGNADVFIVDVFKDKGSSGRSAAFTFMASGIFAEHPMNPTDSNSGGWKSSGMRSWLNGEVLQSFPDEMRSGVMTVSKLSNNAGKTTSPASVTETQDSVWLFSWVECLGPIAWNARSDQSYIDTVDNKEGSQYAWFKQQGVAGEQGHASLDRSVAGSSNPGVWWMRSSAPNVATSFGDMGPEVDNGGYASTAEGVVFGFCL
ncbi:DUF6273 domain-containing protein [Senegalimassilia anaerobia]|uniref:DUF6273 domain-containing protein n=1 Tax=Senegalimassilia anaerobia TaxID=1473216 RepID=UPI003A974BCB